MCSVIGFSGSYDEVVLDRLFHNSRIRGLHAFGYSCYEGDEIVTKKFTDYEQFRASIHSARPSVFIAHFRYSTSGDYQQHENNQPLTYKGQSMVFNGVISQQTLPEMQQRFGCYFGSDNDGWILLDKFDDLSDLTDYSVTFAALMLRDKKITPIRNPNRPLWLGKLGGNSYAASTRDIMQRSGIDDCQMLPENIHTTL